MRTVEIQFKVADMAPAAAYALLADFSSFPRYSNAVRSLNVTCAEPGRSISDWEVNFREGILRWKEEDVFDPQEHTVRFRQLEGDAEHFAGEWSVGASEAGCLISFLSSFDMGFPELNDIVEPIAEQALIENVRSIVTGLIPTCLELGCPKRSEPQGDV
jgi:ribosome-associated toxin RatA of RatAB toxin-antitoxin module